MRITARHLVPGEIDHELIWLSATAVSLGLAVSWFALGLPWPRCVFHDLTGLPCVTCGMTRSAIQFLHGHFFAALKWNPLVFALLWGVVAFDLYALVTLAMRGPRLRIVFRQAERKYARGVIVAVLALNWFYLLSHWRDF
jgi:Protein of unknown function (DUF2752)